MSSITQLSHTFREYGMVSVVAAHSKPFVVSQLHRDTVADKLDSTAKSNVDGSEVCVDELNIRSHASPSTSIRCTGLADRLSKNKVRKSRND